MNARADLHVHSKHSNRPSWLHPRLLGAASNRVAAHALNKDSGLLDRAATRFLELHSDLFEAAGESARRIVA